MQLVELPEQFVVLVELVELQLNKVIGNTTNHKFLPTIVVIHHLKTLGK